MFRLWPLFIEPFIRQLAPRRIMEVGAGEGVNSARLLQYCRDTGGKADIADPSPAEGLQDILARFPEEHVFYPMSGARALLRSEPPDLVLLDGDPNWFTVHNELNLLRRLSAERGLPFPCVLVHNVAWPYGRRDAYANPRAVEEKQPFAFLGVVPGEAGLTEHGLSGRLANANHEGGPRNGVLTAIEDFIATAPFEVDFRTVPFFNGLAVLVPQVRMTPELKALVDGFFSGETLMKACETLEQDRIRVQIELAQAETRLARRTDALARARELLARQQAEIAALKERLAAVKAKA
jgi:hypothetical protein